jgi:hypothetical protein
MKTEKLIRKLKEIFAKIECDTCRGFRSKAQTVLNKIKKLILMTKTLFYVRMFIVLSYYNFIL